MPELPLEELMNYVDLAIEALKPMLGHRMMIRDIQKFLKETYQIDESMERIWEAEQIIYELKNQESEYQHE